ncbi:glycogen phosphorylase [Alkalihalobacillus alcalophilus ATCC 27647 = CGMCC 1.3604]|uniref:Alpha-1,4 glucan phosphorylase n=1 Tax=Alkalihalobacillus alcalophilus ATCC 27647 = CGMCC 1.3604 TaxID=1218173 RepID=A0A094WJ34_ALKAL|nr:glycogen/starch/alpha-glucan phosphorylase [Alkalihalobacillus alcalophilus]KGA95968.1 maltodextrin phosphorylase [Alkalihalobacillus alcalophilus ATCC 27647 = CGMCC 1.3604]MED1561912.1 glycogen/starch/alpha-glucan phosphorylase [Alkalihalobacillus alcalophilus]THG90954.1 glycogen phosphorylase [Alkalihalobacillus alcalophilus ATCC 27647 = CGMCC 1.3604]
MNITQTEFVQSFIDKLTTTFGKTVDEATNKEAYQTVSLLLKDIILRKWQKTQNQQVEQDEKQMYYFSMEFLLGRLIESNLLNAGLLSTCEEGLKELGFNSDKVFIEEHDAGLGNGGLGRLAACFLDSLASLNLPGHGVGIRYKYGLFQQKMVNGYQVELPDYWLKDDYMWETKRSDKSVEVHFGGEVLLVSKDNHLHVEHKNFERVLAIPYDVPIVGYENETVNSLRLWSAESMPNSFHFHSSEGHDYYHYLDYKRSVEQISEFLYPDDSYYEGRLLRLKQQYFLVSAGLQSILSRFKRKHDDFFLLPQKVAIQINDTHPSLVIPELMRLLMDEEQLGWDDAWKITTSTVAYTNHTTLVEALEKWPIDMVQSLLPRIYMIINEINERFCQSIYYDHPELRDKIAEMAIISYGQIHMAHLAIAGSFSVNGVAKLHTDILKNREMKNFHTIFPERFNNKTNGITHRRWLMNVNRNLAQLLSNSIGKNWIKEPRELIQLIKYTDDASFQEEIAKVKLKNKERLAEFIQSEYDIKIDTQSIFDVHIKRLHGYKRQLLNLFHILHLYQLCRDNPNIQMTPRTFIFGAKAAPGYHFAKQVIKLITSTSDKINNDPVVKDKLKVIFLENYNVSLAEKIIPAADISEQISTASKEASGTGNMKLMMNGALTIGTLDGANVEIRDMVGPNNIFTFGLTSEQVFEYQQNGNYRARDIYNSDQRLRVVMDKLVNQFFTYDDVEFKNIYYSLLYNNDEYFVLKDFDSYVEAQQHVEQTYRNQKSWLKKSITNIAHSGKFSSDRTISEYANEIWDIHPL